MQPTFVFPPDRVHVELDDLFSPLDFAALFPDRPNAPMELDLGCGDGSFLTAMAARAPDRNFLGVERLLGRVRRTCRRAAAKGLSNVRVVRLETLYLLRFLIPEGAVATLHLMFPDPWPKRRHQRRRVFQSEFLDVAGAALEPGGELRLTTDDAPYFKHMRAVFAAHLGFCEEFWDPGEDYPQTDFERHFRTQGLEIYRALLRRR